MEPDLPQAVARYEFLLHRHGGWHEDPFQGLVLLIAAPDKPCGIRPGLLEVPDMVWKFGQPHKVLTAIAETIDKHGLPEPAADELAKMDGDPIGLLYHAEAWAVTSHKDDVARVDQMKAAAHDRKLHEMPGKQESRVVMAARFDHPTGLHMITRLREQDGDDLLLGGVTFLQMDSAYYGDIPGSFMKLTEAVGRAV